MRQKGVESEIEGGQRVGQRGMESEAEGWWRVRQRGGWGPEGGLESEA